MPEWLTSEVAQVLVLEAPVVFIGTFAIWSLMHGLIKALEAIVKLTDTLRDIALRQTTVLQDATVTAPDLNQLAETGLD